MMISLSSGMSILAHSARNLDPQNLRPMFYAICRATPVCSSKDQSQAILDCSVGLQVRISLSAGRHHQASETSTIMPKNGGSAANQNIANADLDKMRVEEQMIRGKQWLWFAQHLRKQGYLKGPNIPGDGRLDFECFDTSYVKSSIPFAAERFGKDRSDVGRWLSGKDVQRIVLFGCPTLRRKDIFCAKRLRKFFNIKEATVCNNCPLKLSCKYANRRAGKTDTKRLNLSDTLRIVILYASDASHPELPVSEEVWSSVIRLLHHTIRLSGSCP